MAGYIIDDFTIVSTKYDMSLLFDSKYREAVNTAINRIMMRHIYNSNLRLIPNKYYVEIKGDSWIDSEPF